MKSPLLFALTLASFVSVVQAEQSLVYPEKNPLVAFSVPDDWKTQVKHGSLFVVSPDGGDVIIEVSTLAAASDDDEAAVKEAKSTVEDFKNLKLTESEPAKANGLIVTLIGGEGEDDSGRAHLNLALLKHPDAENPILFSLIASKENAEKYGAACGAIVDSLSAAGSAAPAEAAAASDDVQTFSYPDAKKPDFAIDFPAAWKVKDTDEGVYVESPDKLVAMNVIMVDKADLADAEETLKKKVGERFKEIVWNKGGDPEVNKDEALGLVAVFQHAAASDGEGTEKYSVNLVSYDRKSGDKSLILLVQNPLRAMDKHAEAMEAVVKSIKVR